MSLQVGCNFGWFSSGLGAAGTVTGVGTADFLPKFTGASTIGNSQVQDDATTVFMGGAAATSATALFDVQSTTQGMLVPRMTTIERDAIVVPSNSLLIFNTTARKFQFFDTIGATWTTIESSVIAGETLAQTLTNGNTTSGANIQFSTTDAALFGADWTLAADGADNLVFTSTDATNDLIFTGFNEVDATSTSFNVQNLLTNEAAAGPVITFNQGVNILTLDQPTITAPRAQSFQDASGVIALTSDIPATETLAATLVAGNASGGTNISLTSGDNLLYNVGSGGILASSATGGVRTWTLPDATGTIALTSDIPATETLAATLVAGNASGGTDISLTSGDNLLYNFGSGGILASVSTTGVRTWTLPDATGTIALTSDIPATETLAATLVAGNASGGTDISLTSGDNLLYNFGSGGILASVSTTGVRTWTLPDATGTVALTSDIPVIPITAGGIPFGNGAALVMDAANLFYDDTLNRVGILTGSPQQPLHVEGNIRMLSTSQFFMSATRFMHAAGTSNTFLGGNAGATGTSGTGLNVGVGTNALLVLTTGRSNVALGFNAGNGITDGGFNQFIGQSTGGGVVSGDRHVMVGSQLGVTSDISDTIILGYNVDATAAGQFVVGSSVTKIREYYFNSGVTDASFGSTSFIRFQPTGGSGTDKSATDGTFFIAGSRGTGTGIGGDIIFETAPAGGAGTVLNALVERMRITDDGNIGIGTAADPDAGSLLELSSITQGFLIMRMTSVQRDAIASLDGGLMLYDDTNNDLNYYNATAWRRVVNSPASSMAAGGITYATSGSGIDTDATLFFWDTTKKSVGIGTATFGDTTVNSLSLATGTAPTTDIADQFSMYSEDIVAGNAAPHFRTENGDIIKLYQVNTYTRDATIVEDRTLLASASATATNNNNVIAALIADLQALNLVG